MEVVAERWLPCPGFEAEYDVSSHGRVRRILANPRTRIGRILTLSPGRGGVPLARLCAGSRRKTALVHRLVAQLFLPPSTLPCVLFKEGRSCRVENLEWGRRHRGAARGRANARAKLDEHDARRVRVLLADGRTVSEVARRFGVDRRTIRKLRDGETWAHVRD